MGAALTCDNHPPTPGKKHVTHANTWSGRICIIAHQFLFLRFIRPLIDICNGGGRHLLLEEVTPGSDLCAGYLSV